MRNFRLKNNKKFFSSLRSSLWLTHLYSREDRFNFFLNILFKIYVFYKKFIFVRNYLYSKVLCIKMLRLFKYEWSKMYSRLKSPCLHTTFSWMRFSSKLMHSKLNLIFHLIIELKWKFKLLGYLLGSLRISFSWKRLPSKLCWRYQRNIIWYLFGQMLSKWPVQFF